MGINSNVKKSDVLSTKEINELAVKFQNSVDKEDRDILFEKIWLAVKKYTISNAGVRGH